jgi:hypothetical protein
MLTRIEVGEQEYCAYKQPEAYIAPGTYYVYQSSFKRTPSQKAEFERIKKVLELKAVQNPQGKFLWLAPYEKWVKRVVDGTLDMIPAQTIEPDWSIIGVEPTKLRTWQRDCITEAWTFLASGLRYTKGWIARIGSGKTLAGLAAMNMFEPEKCLVLADKYLFETWYSEANKWGFPRPILSTYESAHKHNGRDIECLILDEVLKLKNPETQRSKAVEKISRNCRLVLGFTGIAVAAKRCQDFRWLRAVAPGSVPATEKAWQFAFGLDTRLEELGGNKAYVTDTYNEEAITNFVSPFVRTIDQTEVINELPDIQFNYIEVDAPGQFNLIKSGGATTKGNPKRLAQVLQCTDGFIYNDDDKPVRVTSPKIPAVKDFVDNLGEPVILVTNWSEGVQILREQLLDYDPSIIEGGSNFIGEITRFKEGHTQVMILNAGFSKGMNLQGVCRTIVFLSTSSKPDDYEQMLGRVYRPGQKLGVNIVFFTCKDSLDKRRIELVQKHKEYSAEVVERLLLEELNK